MISQNLHMFVLAAPLLSGILVNLLGRGSRRWVTALTLGSLGFSTVGAVFVLRRVLLEGSFRYTVGNWTPPFGIELVVDPLSALMLLLVSSVAFLATFSALKSVDQELPGKQHVFFTLYLIMIAGLLGLVLTADAFNLYVLLEITSITTYGLIAMGKGRAPLASFNYIIMGSIGACFYLLGVGYLYILTGTLNMADIASRLPALGGMAAVATAFAFILVGLCVKMAFFPLHGWLPNAYSLAPSGASVMIAPLMTKVTVYLMARVFFVMYAPWQSAGHHGSVHTLIIWAASIAIFAASALALGQRNLRRMLTYIIVAEVGYMVGGIWLANAQAITGALLHIVNDALMTLCLFLAASAIAYRRGSLDFGNLKGLYRTMPLTMAAFTVGAFSMIGVPPTAGFFSKWYLILGGLEAGHWEFVAALVTSSLVNAVLFFRIIEFGYFQTEESTHGHGHEAVAVKEAPLQMLKPLIIVAAALIVVGLGSGRIVSGIISLVIPGNF